MCPAPRTCVGSSCHVDCAHDGKAEESNGTFYNNEISTCTAQQVNESDSREFVAGTFVWSGFDYLGEARGWPQTVKPRGVITDIAGFKKEPYYWFRAWWLSTIDATGAGRPPPLVWGFGCCLYVTGMVAAQDVAQRYCAARSLRHSGAMDGA